MTGLSAARASHWCVSSRNSLIPIDIRCKTTRQVHDIVLSNLNFVGSKLNISVGYGGSPLLQLPATRRRAGSVRLRRKLSPDKASQCGRVAKRPVLTDWKLDSCVKITLSTGSKKENWNFRCRSVVGPEHAARSNRPSPHARRLPALGPRSGRIGPFVH